MDFVLGCIDIGLRLPPLLLFEEAGFFPHLGGIGFPKHARRFDLRFNVVRILRTLPVIFQGSLGRFETHFIEVLFLFLVQWWTVIHDPRLVRIHVGYSGALSDGTCTGRWLWIRDCNFSFVSIANHLVNDCKKIRLFCPYSLLHRSPLSCFWLSSAVMPGFSLFFLFLVHCWLCIWNQHCLGWKIFCTCSRFPEACVSERQTFWTIRNSRFPEVRWTEQHPEFVLSFFPRPHLRVSRTPRLQGLLEECCPTDTLCRETRQSCACFHLSWTN